MKNLHNFHGMQLPLDKASHGQKKWQRTAEEDIKVQIISGYLFDLFGINLKLQKAGLDNLVYSASTWLPDQEQ